MAEEPAVLVEEGQRQPELRPFEVHVRENNHFFSSIWFELTSTNLIKMTIDMSDSESSLKDAALFEDMADRGLLGGLERVDLICEAFQDDATSAATKLFATIGSLPGLSYFKFTSKVNFPVSALTVLSMNAQDNLTTLVVLGSADANDRIGYTSLVNTMNSGVLGGDKEALRQWGDALSNCNKIKHFIYAVGMGWTSGFRVNQSAAIFDLDRCSDTPLPYTKWDPILGAVAGLPDLESLFFWIDDKDNRVTTPTTKLLIQLIRRRNNNFMGLPAIVLDGVKLQLSTLDDVATYCLNAADTFARFQDSGGKFTVTFKAPAINNIFTKKSNDLPWFTVSFRHTGYNVDRGFPGYYQVVELCPSLFDPAMVQSSLDDSISSNDLYRRCFQLNAFKIDEQSKKLLYLYKHQALCGFEPTTAPKESWVSALSALGDVRTVRESFERTRHLDPNLVGTSLHRRELHRQRQRRRRSVEYDLNKLYGLLLDHCDAFVGTFLVAKKIGTVPVEDGVPNDHKL